MNVVVVVMLYLIPAALLFAAAYSGWRWLFLLPILGWPLLLFGLDIEHLWLSLLMALAGFGAVWLGLLFRRTREEPQS